MTEMNSLQTWLTTAQVSNKKHLNSRTMFAYSLQIDALTGGHFKARRSWKSASDEEIAVEEVVWCQQHGLVSAQMSQPHLQEKGHLEVNQFKGTSVLSSYRTKHSEKKKPLIFANSPCTLLSVPFEIAKHWQDLMQGKRIHLDYTVLKVQAHTGITLHKKDTDSSTVISVTPKKWFWRLLFGSTDFHYEKGSQRLIKIDGLLEPRDRNIKGKYVEYLGLARFDKAIDFGFFRGL
ncbi:hypothetical protein EAG18_03670 [Pseudoalteromonas sp. J010]|uniref:hypothetical protein n=1 Tax=Pseudoalteromonas sp. J010 TaxID=998465 RepID=UPI000F6457F8|nr:hypothetical protein [Pseudoalteromonas sp. J010]RRS10039.1 hypothetical protein EAG18_03670 [Pseudoalteromonas sp. J010]